MQVSSLETLLARVRPKLIYVVTDFQNPKGTTLSLQRRKELVALAQRHGTPILEDDPYGELRFKVGALPPLAALDDTGLVIYTSTFSKTLAPGMRLGWLHAKDELLRAVTVMKQASDLHTATLAQRAAAKLLETFDYDGHLTRLRQVYGARCDAMTTSLAKWMPPGTEWTRPEGGLFVWVRLPRGVKDSVLFEKAIARSVAFVPGSPFFVEPGRSEFIRLNYSNRPADLIDEGLRRLGQATSAQLEETGASA
jgi:2-aminoadipate transaminase